MASEQPPITPRTDQLIAELMSEVTQLKAKQNALVSMVCFFVKKMGLPDVEQEMFIKAFLEIAGTERDRILVEHPWYDDYWKDQLGDIIGSNPQE